MGVIGEPGMLGDRGWPVSNAFRNGNKREGIYLFTAYL